MKLKFIPLVLAALTLSACAGGNTEPTTVDPTSTPTSVAPAESWYYLGFLSGDHALRIDLFDIPEGLQFSYGNAALSQSVNNLTVDANTKVTANKNLTEEESINFIIVKDKKDGSRHTLDVSLGIEGNSLQDFLALDGNKLDNCDRVYIAISYGSEAKWTHGLNAKLDEDINARKNINQ